MAGMAIGNTWNLYVVFNVDHLGDSDKVGVKEAILVLNRKTWLITLALTLVLAPFMKNT